MPGRDLRLSIDAALQQVGERALQNGIGLAQAHGNPADAGAFVAMDTRNGEILALGSAPSFDPNVFTRPMSQRTYDERYGERAGSPLFDRAVEGAYAIGSTFKVVTAAAGLATGATTVERVYNDTGAWSSGAQVRRNAGNAVFGPVSLVWALAVSVDTYFYDLGERLNADPVRHPRGGELQAWARRFGFGAPTGIDLPNEQQGVVPDPRRGPELWKAELRCRRERHLDNCHIALPEHDWTVGDNVSLAIGQGDFAASPLQLATAYAAIANGGTVVRPHVGLAVLGDKGRIADRITPRPARRIEILGLQAIRDGLLGATAMRDGTAYDVFAGFGRQVYGKTGTVQMDGRPDQSWFVAYVEDPQRPIVVAAVIEDGGFGAEAAAPAVRQILSQWIYGRPGRAVSGTKGN
ncbi:penicillin-binding transpeptidase domain-containing protein [Conexibacter sp. CPCC 206217]|uniref:penicillin-binding transpeptidase domain-containing protein n=1 Tax=Conexibacter sp. CPCC 206217 TaxID=3064574 RepID=UPI0027265B4F|nr:penicillin-binding transpeptidase domain-containing protein [Conexibacter sp. CPCC 206217]MDO8209125.1 penicillin-binding transpeptidase domain-containing protein [Conexibacter sp. CPCC 206217]